MNCRVKLVGKNPGDLLPLLREYRLSVVALEEKHCDLVIAYGGDGTMLSSERDFPGVPKLVMRDFATAPQCEEHGSRTILEAFLAGRLKEVKLPKIRSVAGGKTLFGVNDIFIHNYERMNALRYRVRINDELYANEVVGDAVGLSSVHGSTAYYKSITHSIFRTGIGLSFSNSTEEVNHLVLPESAQVRISIVRGPGLMIADNDRNTVLIPEKGEVLLDLAQEQCMTVFGLDEFMCPKCRLLRHPNKSPYSGYIAQ